MRLVVLDVERMRPLLNLGAHARAGLGAGEVALLPADGLIATLRVEEELAGARAWARISTHAIDPAVAAAAIANLLERDTGGRDPSQPAVAEDHARHDALPQCTATRAGILAENRRKSRVERVVEHAALARTAIGVVVAGRPRAAVLVEGRDVAAAKLAVAVHRRGARLAIAVAEPAGSDRRLIVVPGDTRQLLRCALIRRDVVQRGLESLQGPVGQPLLELARSSAPPRSSARRRPHVPRTDRQQRELPGPRRGVGP